MGHRLECFLQHDSMQCGIACLAMICKHYGKEFSIETLSRYCFASTEGVSLLGISEAANKLGLHSVCGRVSMKQMQQAPLLASSTGTKTTLWCSTSKNKERSST